METKTVGIRFPVNEVQVLKRVAEYRGISISGFCRMTIRKELAELNFLPREQKKALGIGSVREGD